MMSLTPDQIETFGNEIDAIERDIKSSLGQKDREYILRMIRIRRALAIAGRLGIYASLPMMPLGFPFMALLAAGTASLGVSKILENMEIGHNVIHGQWDWMNDPEISSATWEWDNVVPAAQWKHSHNVMHHKWTNVLGRDRDVGYQILRVTEEQPWKPAYVFQPAYALLLAAFFEWGIATHDLDLEKMRSGELKLEDVRPQIEQITRKVLRQSFKEYLLWPLLAGPFFFWVAGANFVASLIRNVWSFAIIFCGHFPDGVKVFTEKEIENETRGGFCVRQIMGSCNIDGGPLFHVMSGNLSFQIEHHLFPDMPSNRYVEAAPRVKALCEKYGIPYNTGSFARQLGTTFRKLFRFALPKRISEVTA